MARIARQSVILIVLVLLATLAGGCGGGGGSSATRPATGTPPPVPDSPPAPIQTVTQRLNDLREVVQPHTMGYEALDETPYNSSHGTGIDK